MEERLRLFVAVELPMDIREALFIAVQEASRDLNTAKWVPAKNMHITLKFLGSCADERVASIVEQLKKAVAQFKPFEFELCQLGGFPTPQKARVFWAGGKGGDREYVSLAGKCDKSLERSGFTRETRIFHPHLTLARFRTPQDIRPVIEGFSFPEQTLQPIKVEEIVLFRSHLSPKGPTYERLLVIPLAGDLTSRS